MNKAIELSLKTWYPKGHPLHYDLHHPLGKLVGEWGELLDDYMKHLYKPGYEWEPIEELVDVWYYIRILAYQCNKNLNDQAELPIRIFTSSDIDYLISSAIGEASIKFNRLCLDEARNQKCLLFGYTIAHNYAILRQICKLSDLTIDQLTEASWEKLKPGSERGEEWRKARDYEQK